MIHRRLVTAVCVAASLAVVAAPAVAKHKRPITKKYPASAPMPDPSNWVPGGNSVCAMRVPNSYHVQSFKAPEPGLFKVELTGYDGDWDLLLVDRKGRELAASGSGDLGAPERFTYRVKKAGELRIVACNWAGGPSGTVKYTFNYR